MAANLALYRAFFAAFNVTDPKAAFDQGQYSPLPETPIAERIAARLQIQPDAHLAIVGGIGFGKTTQLLAAQKSLEGVADLTTVSVDVGAVTSLSALKPSALLTLAGLWLVKSQPRPVSAQVERASQSILEHANGQWVDDDDSDEPREYQGSRWQAGVLQKPNPVAAEIRAVAPYLGSLFQGLGRRLVVFFDGLDRVGDMELLVGLLRQDLEAFRRLSIGVVLALPERMLFGRARHFLDAELDWSPLPPVDVESTDKGIPYLKSVLERRAAGMINDEAAEKLVGASGGVFRDLIALARTAGEEAYMDGSAQVDARHVDVAADRFGRKLIFGLSKEQMQTLLRVRDKGEFVETNDSDVALLATGRVLQYARPHSRFGIHPTILPLLRTVWRAA